MTITATVSCHEVLSAVEATVEQSRTRDDLFDSRERPLVLVREDCLLGLVYDGVGLPDKLPKT